MTQVSNSTAPRYTEELPIKFNNLVTFQKLFNPNILKQTGVVCFDIATITARRRR